jgi:hypothetical protein
MDSIIACEGWNYVDWMTKRSGEIVFYPHAARSYSNARRLCTRF